MFKFNQIIDAMSKNPILSKVKAEVLQKKIKSIPNLHFMPVEL